MEKVVYHVPVLPLVCADALVMNPSGVYVDLTFGGGGHSREILGRLDGGGRLFGFDQDADAVGNALDDDRFTFVLSNFRYLRNWMRYFGVGRLDGILADLGVSAHHFDAAERGFSFRFDGPLDMRMNRRGLLTAADVVNDYDEERLADVFRLYGELGCAGLLARRLVEERTRGRIDRTGRLAEIARLFIGREREKKDLAKVFQALRIEVNQEMAALNEMLLCAADLLCPGGRLVVLSYHSLEDRIVKNYMRTGNAEGRVVQDFFGVTNCPFRAVTNKAVCPSEEEQRANPRSRSAKLRVAVRVGNA